MTDRDNSMDGAVWFAAAGNIARSGPYKTQKKAWDAVRLAPDIQARFGRTHFPDTIIWPEWPEEDKKPKPLRSLEGYDQPDPPVIVKLEWRCGLAISVPHWQGIDSYECDECTGEGEIALPFDDLELDDEENLVGLNQTVYCTSCGQELEDISHFDEESVQAAIDNYNKAMERRKKFTK